MQVDETLAILGIGLVLIAVVISIGWAVIKVVVELIGSDEGDSESE